MQQLEEIIGKVLSTTVDVPGLTDTVARVIRLTRGSFRGGDGELSLPDLVSTDLGLTARLMRLANSPFFRHAEPIDSIESAVRFLGSATVRSVSLSIGQWDPEATVGDTVEADTLDAGTLWHHSHFVAEAMSGFAISLAPDSRERWYLAGLLHDVGIAVLAHKAPEEYAVLLRLRGQRQERLGVLEEEFLGVSHAGVGAALARRWCLSEFVVDCLRFHESIDAVPSRCVGETRQAIEVLAGLERWSVASQAGLFRATSGSLRATMATNAEPLAALAEASGLAPDRVNEIICAALDRADARSGHWAATA